MMMSIMSLKMTMTVMSLMMSLFSPSQIQGHNVQDAVDNTVHPN